MNNPGINITINGKHVTRAGFDTENFVLTAVTTLVRRKDGSEEFMLKIEGLDSDNDDYVQWFEKKVVLGDIITMEIIEGPFDPSKLKYPNISKEDKLKEKLELFYKLQEELKEHIKD